MKNLQLTALALAAESIYIVIAFIPLMPVVALTAIFYSPKFATVAGVLLFIGFWWLIQPDGRLDDSLIEVTRNDKLRRMVGDLCDGLNAPMPQKIVLSDELNAAAHQSAGLLSLIGVRRTLILGIPLLRVLSVDELRAVVAHELGHLSRQHGRLGHWIYRVRAKWETEMYQRESDGMIDSLLRTVSDWIAPVFIRKSADWSLSCEFEADQSAAKLDLKWPLATALIKLEALSTISNSEVSQELLEANLRSDPPPTDYWEKVLSGTRRYASAQYITKILEKARARKPGAHVMSHPATVRRIEHLGLAAAETIARIDWSGASMAGNSLFGDEWPKIYAACASREFESLSKHWHIQHHHLRWYAALSAGGADVVVSDDPTNQIIDRLCAEDYLSNSDTTLDALRVAHVRNLESAYAAYAYGCALLRREQGEGVELVRTAHRQDRSYAPQGTSAVHEFLHEHATHREAMSAWRAHQNALDWSQNFVDDLWSRLVTSTLQPLPQVKAKVLSDALATITNLDACWATRVPSRQVGQRVLKVNVFVLRVDPSVKPVDSKREGETVGHVRALARGLIAPNELIRTLVFYTTEPIDPKLLGRLTSTIGATIVPPKKPINENMIKIDSL